MSIIKFISSTFREMRYQVLVLVFFIVLAGTFEGVGMTLFLPLLGALLAGPEVSSLETQEGVLDRIFRALGLSEASLPLLLLFIILVFGLKNLFLYFQKTRSSRVSVDFEVRLKKRIIESFFASDWQFYFKEKTGALMNALEMQAKNSSVAFRIVVLFVSEIIGVLIYCIVGFALSWQAFAASLVTGGLCFYVVKDLARKSRTVGMEAAQLRSDSNGVLLENLTGVKLIKGNRLEGRRVESVFRLFQRIGQAEFKSFWYTSIVATLPDFIMVCLVCMVLYVSHVFFRVPV